MKRYAFIDVANTKGSAKALGFQIDPEKLYKYLKYDKWSCDKMFWYDGRIINEKNEKNREKIKNIGYEMRDKRTHSFKDKRDLIIDVECPKCHVSFTHRHKRKIKPKANCDVELTIDCLELSSPGNELLIFTGDGDFRDLLEKIHEKGSMVRLFSTTKEDKDGNYRLSTRLKELFTKKENIDWLIFTELNNLKNRLKKEDK